MTHMTHMTHAWPPTDLVAGLAACAARLPPGRGPTCAPACLAACHFAIDGVGRADGKGPQLRSVSEQFLFFKFFVYTHRHMPTRMGM